MVQQLKLDSCPHCGISAPNFIERSAFQQDYFYWLSEMCNSCKSVVVSKRTMARVDVVIDYWPKAKIIDELIPDRPKEYLRQAIISPPAGAIMLAASSVDEMLKQKLIRMALYIAE